MSNNANQFAPLPPAVSGHHIGLSIYCPIIPTNIIMFLSEGDVFLDARQLAALFELTPAVLAQHTPDFQHDWSPPPLRRMCTVYLWSRAKAISALQSGAQNSTAFVQWIEQTHKDFYQDFQQTVEDCVPQMRGTAGAELTVAGAAKRLAARFGAHITRQTVFGYLEELGLIQRDTSVGKFGYWKVTSRGNSAPVYSRTVKIPGGHYEQVFLTEAGYDMLAAHVSTLVQPSLIDGIIG